jgi:hypothetical protein
MQPIIESMKQGSADSVVIGNEEVKLVSTFQTFLVFSGPAAERIPESLKASSRSIEMVKPDMELIARALLVHKGFSLKTMDLAATQITH